MLGTLDLLVGMGLKKPLEDSKSLLRRRPCPRSYGRPLRSVLLVMTKEKMEARLETTKIPKQFYRSTITVGPTVQTTTLRVRYSRGVPYGTL